MVGTIGNYFVKNKGEVGSQRPEIGSKRWRIRKLKENLHFKCKPTVMIKSVFDLEVLCLAYSFVMEIIQSTRNFQKKNDIPR
jgi:hypothetical protein